MHESNFNELLQKHLLKKIYICFLSYKSTFTEQSYCIKLPKRYKKCEENNDA